VILRRRARGLEIFVGMLAKEAKSPFVRNNAVGFIIGLLTRGRDQL